MGCQTSRQAGKHAIVATPANLKQNLEALDASKTKDTTQNIEIEVSNSDSQQEMQSTDSTGATEATVDQESRLRALSAQNTDEKQFQVNEAQTNALDNTRRKLTIMGTRPVTNSDNHNTKIKGDGGIGNGAHGFACKCEKQPIIYSVITRPGNDPQKRIKENQDNYCVIDQYGTNDGLCVCVFDGHGPNGAKASKFIKINLPKTWLRMGIHQEEEKDKIKKILHEGCISVNRKMSNSDIDVYVSGTTGILSYIKNNELYVANVGDSRAVLGRMVDSKIKAVELSSDHKPDRPDEKARILKSGGRVFEWGVPRVWKRDVDMPGLAMARSFGDLAAESVGVFAEPEITHTELCSNDQFLILATDGIWEFLSSQQVCDIVASQMQSGKSRDDCHKAAIKCIKESVSQWYLNEDVVDDATIAILFLNFEQIRVDITET